MVAALYFMSTFIDTLESTWAPYVLWPLYWWWQGAVCTGIWVIAHECGACRARPRLRDRERARLPPVGSGAAGWR